MANRLWKRLKAKKQLWLSLFIAVIMVFSAFGVIFYGFADSSDIYRYNGYKFTPTTTGLLVKVQGKQFVVGSLPQDLVSINLSTAVANQLRQVKMLYLTYDPNSTSVQDIAAVEFQLKSDLANLGIYAAPAFTKTNEFNLPVITCLNATQFVPVIEFRDANKTSAAFDNGCIVLNAAYLDDFSRLKDRLLLGMLGVMN
ncbi:MAG: hypothetical protein V1837_07800 [Candidatus Woesearchaeota archaeon]